MGRPTRIYEKDLITQVLRCAQDDRSVLSRSSVRTSSFCCRALTLTARFWVAPTPLVFLRRWLELIFEPGQRPSESPAPYVGAPAAPTQVAGFSRRRELFRRDPDNRAPAILRFPAQKDSAKPVRLPAPATKLLQAG